MGVTGSRAGGGGGGGGAAGGGGGGGGRAGRADAAGTVGAREGLPVIEEIAPRVFAYVQPDGGWYLNNMGYFVPGGGGGVLSIDTAATAERTREYLRAIGRSGGDGVRTLVSTHHHGDHTNGNSIVPHATIVGHERCREEMLAAGTIVKMDAFGVLEPVDWGDVQLAPPFVTFSDRINCYVDDMMVELHHFGTAAHTTNDVVAFVPEHRILFSGDLAFNGVTPFYLMGSGSGLLEALAAMRALEPEIVVPGHGGLCGPEIFDRVEGYVSFVRSRARAGHDSGASPLDVARETDLGEFGALVDSERFVGNLHREYAELGGLPRGGTVDLGAAFADMVAMNGGLPLHCSA